MRNEYDFSDAKRAKDVPHLARLHAAAKNKTVITLMLDDDVFNALQTKAEHDGEDYQAVINQTLREALNARFINETTRRQS